MLTLVLFCYKCLLQVISAAAALSQTSSASSQETQSNLLSIAQAGLQSAQMSNKAVSSDQISQIVSIAAVGTGTTKKSYTGSSGSNNKNSGNSKSGKRLLSVDGTTSTAAASAAWLGGVRHVLAALPLGRPNRRLQEDAPAATMPAAIKGAAIQSVMDQAAQLMLQQSTPATGLLSMASQGLAVSAANLLGSSYAEGPLAVGEVLQAAAESSSNKAASTTAPENVLVEFNAPLLGVCEVTDGSSAPTDAAAGCTDSAVSVVLHYYQDATLLLNTDIAAALEAGSSGANATDGATNSTNAAADPLQGLQVVSGAVVLAVAGSNADERIPCLNTSSGSSSSGGDIVTLPVGCGALLTLPIIGALDSNSSKEPIVLRIDSTGVPVPDGLLLGVSNSSTTAAAPGRRLLAGSATTAQVWTSRSGSFMLGQITRTGGVLNDTAGSNQTAPDNTTACGNATLDANATACGNATLDANATIISNTTNLNSTGTTNTTSSSPEPLPPGGNGTQPNATSPYNTVSANSTSNATAPGSNTTGNAYAPANQISPSPTQPQAVPSPSPLPEAQASPTPSPSPSPQQQLGSGTAGPSDTTVALNLTFPMQFSELSSSQSLLNTFKADVAANVAKTLGIDATLVQVVNVREGSVKCDVIVTVPASYNSSEVTLLQAAVDQLVAAPDTALGDVKTKYNILQAITAAKWVEPDTSSVSVAGLAAVTAQLAKLTKISTGEHLSAGLMECADATSCCGVGPVGVRLAHVVVGAFTFMQSVLSCHV